MTAAFYGLAIGSFLNVVIWRLPRGGSISTPTWSYCPRCEHRLGAFDLFPVASFLLLGTKCRYCKAPISWRYPGIELLTGGLFGLVAGYVWWQHGAWYDIVFLCLFTAILLCVFFIDLEHFVIPDGLSVLGILLGLAHGLVAGTFVDAVAGMLGYAAVIYLIGLLSYVYLVAVLDKRKGAGQAAWEYARENGEDWAYVAVSSLAVIVPLLRRFVAARWGEAEPLEGYTAEEIEADEDAGGMGGGDGKLAAAIGANLGLGLALGSLGFAIFSRCGGGYNRDASSAAAAGGARPHSLRASDGGGGFASLVLWPSFVRLVHTNFLGSSKRERSIVRAVGILAVLAKIIKNL